MRTLAAAGELELLARITESVKRLSAGVEAGSRAISLIAAEGLGALAADRADEAVSHLSAATARQDELGLAYDSACLKLDLARALDRAGDPAGAAEKLQEARSLLPALGCVNAFQEQVLRPQSRGSPRNTTAAICSATGSATTCSSREVEQYGRDSFGDPDYVSVYGLKPEAWYARGVRLLARTAVECTRDPLADLIGRDIASVARASPRASSSVIVDPFAGSANTLYWIMRHLSARRGVGFELDDAVFEVTRRTSRSSERVLRSSIRSTRPA